MALDKDKGEALLVKYKEALLSLVFHMMKKLQFRFNADQLLQLDNTSLNDNNETGICLNNIFKESFRL